MVLFKKKGEVIDFTQLQKRGLIKQDTEKSESPERELVDFTNAKKSEERSFAESNDFDFFNSNQENNQSPLTFMDSLASSEKHSESSDNQNNSESTTSSFEINELRLKLDDAEYKITLLEEKIRNLENRLDL